VVSYNVYKDAVLFSNVASNSGQVTGLTASTAYSFTVSALDAAGNESAQSTAFSVTTNAAAAGLASILDDYAGIGWDINRKLRSAYTGDSIEVRRSGDNVLANIVFDANGDLDTAALLNHVGSGFGYVRTIYNHGIIGSDLIQTNNSQQALIVDAGVIHTHNGKPALKQSGSAVGYIATGLSFAGGVTEFSIFSDSAPSGTIMSSDTTSKYYGNMNSSGATSSAGGDTYRKNGVDVFEGISANGLGAEFTGTETNLMTCKIPDLSLWTKMETKYPVAGFYQVEDFFGKIIITEALSAIDIDAIENNIMNYYGIV